MSESLIDENVNIVQIRQNTNKRKYNSINKKKYKIHASYKIKKKSYLPRCRIVDKN